MKSLLVSRDFVSELQGQDTSWLLKKIHMRRWAQSGSRRSSGPAATAGYCFAGFVRLAST